MAVMAATMHALNDGIFSLQLYTTAQEQPNSWNRDIILNQLSIADSDRVQKSFILGGVDSNLFSIADSIVHIKQERNLLRTQVGALKSQLDQTNEPTTRFSPWQWVSIGFVLGFVVALLLRKKTKCNKRGGRANTTTSSIELKAHLGRALKQLETEKKEVNKLQTLIKKNDKLVEKAIADKQAAEKVTGEAKKELKAEKSEHANTQAKLRAELDTTKQLRADMVVFTNELAMAKDLKSLAKNCVSLLSSYNDLLQFADHLAGASLKGLNDDDYNYYYARILRKFNAACTAINNEEFQAFATELTMLAQTGMVPAKGIVQKSVLGSQNAATTLKAILHSKIFKQLVGAAIVMSDEFALLLPAMIKDGCPDVSKATELTKKLCEAARNMGYDVVYAAPFEEVSNCVKICDFTTADIPSQTILEIKHMAVNFGTAKEETLVTAKE